MTYGILFFLSLLLTLIIEVPILFIIIRFWFKNNIGTREIISNGIIINLLSLPYLWFVFSFFIPLEYYILIGEILVVVMESILLVALLKIDFKKAIIISLITNAISYFVGQIVF